MLMACAAITLYTYTTTVFSSLFCRGREMGISPSHIPGIIRRREDVHHHQMDSPSSLSMILCCEEGALLIVSNA